MCFIFPELTLAVVRTQEIYGIYSDLEYNEEGGDLLGMELFIFPGDQYYALIHSSDGEPSKPYLLPLTLTGDDGILIEYPPECIIRKITGTIFKDRLVIRVHYKSHVTDPISLRRGDSYWQ